MKLAFVVAAALAVATPAFAATTTFSDSAMLLSSYTITTHAPSSAFTTDVVQAPQGQNDDSSLGTIYIASGSTTPTPRFRMLGVDYTYDPSAMGAISTIDASLDQLVALYYNGPRLDTGTVNLQIRLLAQQDGQLYRARSVTDVAATPEVWRSTSVAGLTSADFLKLNPNDPFATASGTGLDFAGSVIRFGFEIAPFGVQLIGGGESTGTTVSYHFVDNLKITLNTQDPGAPVGGVPEPSTWAMMILGFGLAGSVVRRRRMALA